MNEKEAAFYRTYDSWLRRPYEYPSTSSPERKTRFDEVEENITSYMDDYIAEFDSLPDIDDVFEMFDLKTYEDYEKLSRLFERERRLTTWKHSET
jgi:hypothetical protein